MSTFCYFVRGAEHARLCELSMQSVQTVEPYARFVVVADDAAQAILAPLGVHILPDIMPQAPIMLANIAAQLSALYAVRESGKTVWFLDTDTLLVQPLPSLMTDLFVTWRDHVGLDQDTQERVQGIAKQMPYNYGVLGVRTGLAGTHALIWLYETVAKMAPDLQRWYGNQMALARLAGAPPKSGEVIEERPIRWSYERPDSLCFKLTIHKAPCEVYNYTPQAQGEDVSSRYVLHFKGGKRALMGAYLARLYDARETEKGPTE